MYLNRIRRLFKKSFFSIIFIAILVVGVYWFKNQIRIDLFKFVTFSNTFPFKYLQRNFIIVPESGDIIIDESFNHQGFFRKNWWKLWMREKGLVIQDYDNDGINKSRCLIVRSSSDKSWAYCYQDFIKVKKGDAFSYEGLTAIQVENGYTTFCITTYDQSKNVLKWIYEEKTVNQNNKIISVKKRFTVAEGIALIRLRIIGFGAGEFRYDDITLRKL